MSRNDVNIKHYLELMKIFLKIVVSSMFQIIIQQKFELNVSICDANCYAERFDHVKSRWVKEIRKQKKTE